jgi:hypothetical protein
VYHTADRPMLEIVGLAAGAGLVLWWPSATGWAACGPLAFVLLGVAVAVDVLRWERVAVSAHNLWFQRGYRSRVHQVALENIRDVRSRRAKATASPCATAATTARAAARAHEGQARRRLAQDRRASGVDAVEAVANHLRMRLAQMRDREPARACCAAATAPRPSAGRAGGRAAPALCRLRRKRRPASAAEAATRRTAPAPSRSLGCRRRRAVGESFDECPAA